MHPVMIRHISFRVVSIIFRCMEPGHTGHHAILHHGETHTTPYTLALLIRSETGFAPVRAFTPGHLIRINDLTRIKLNHIMGVVSHQFSLLRFLSVDATQTRQKQRKSDQINARRCIRIRCRVPGVFPRASRSSPRLSTKYYYKLPVAFVLFMRVKVILPVVIYNINAM